MGFDLDLADWHNSINKSRIYESIPSPRSHSQVSTVGMSAPNMMKSIEKKRNPVLLKTLLASLPMFR